MIGNKIGIPALISFGSACCACLASWGWTGIQQLRMKFGTG
jgi:hypothetical protein